MRKKKIESYEDLEVYQLLFELALEMHGLSLTFPKFELYELGSQIRRSSNAIPANLAEGWNNKHIKIYLEGINRALGELQETKHHLKMAHRKGYLSDEQLKGYIDRYNQAGKMLWALAKSLRRTQHPTPNT